MRKSLIAWCMMILLAIGYVSCNKESITTTPGSTDNAPLNPNQQKLLNLVNEVRGSGCNCGNVFYPPVGAVTWNTLLEQAAKKHSEYMNSTGNFSHTGAGGSDPGDRIEAEGYNWIAYGENIAMGYTTEEGVVDAWLKSVGHCANIMDKDFKEMGVATSGSYWTQEFATHQ
jgi:uncharacterized protein YkwD